MKGMSFSVTLRMLTWPAGFFKVRNCSLIAQYIVHCVIALGRDLRLRLVKNATSVPRRSIFPDSSVEVAVVFAATSDDNVSNQASVRFMGFEDIHFCPVRLIIAL